jgi:hypothetical protein
MSGKEHDGELSAQEKHFHGDILDSRLEPVLDTAFKLPNLISDEITDRIRELLAGEEIESQVELGEILMELDKAIAVKNSPEAREIRKHLLERFGDTSAT